jgi:hypothetical protein
MLQRKSCVLGYFVLAYFIPRYLSWVELPSFTVEWLFSEDAVLTAVSPIDDALNFDLIFMPREITVPDGIIVSFLVSDSQHTQDVFK